jgi:hypothetical protein
MLTEKPSRQRVVRLQYSQAGPNATAGRCHPMATAVSGCVKRIASLLLSRLRRPGRLGTVAAAKDGCRTKGFFGAAAHGVKFRTPWNSCFVSGITDNRDCLSNGIPWSVGSAFI